MSTALVAKGDPDALAVLDEFCRYTAVGVANLVHVLDPEVVVIAGDWSTSASRWCGA